MKDMKLHLGNVGEKFAVIRVNYWYLGKSESSPSSPLPPKTFVLFHYPSPLRRLFLRDLPTVLSLGEKKFWEKRAAELNAELD